MKHVADGLADALGHIIVRMKDSGAELPLAAASGGSIAQLDFAIHAFRNRCDAAFDTQAKVEEMISDARVDYTRAANRCDSPIEKRILPWLIFADYGTGYTNPPSVVLHDAEPITPSEFNTVYILPQMPIGKFRLDFLVVASKRGLERSLFAFECDGSEFHRSPTKDTGRDLTLASLGIVTVRVEGREIYSSPGVAVERLAYRVRQFFAGAD